MYRDSNCAIMTRQNISQMVQVRVGLLALLFLVQDNAIGRMFRETSTRLVYPWKSMHVRSILPAKSARLP